MSGIIYMLILLIQPATDAPWRPAGPRAPFETAKDCESARVLVDAITPENIRAVCVQRQDI